MALQPKALIDTGPICTTHDEKLNDFFAEVFVDTLVQT